MATIGQALTSSESGWKRIDDTHSAFKRPTGNWIVHSDVSLYGGSKTYSSTLGSKIQFKFKGTKLRVIATRWSGFPNIKITIDGATESYSQNGASLFQCLLFEKTGLENKLHTVEIESITSGNMDVDAIDIDENGQLLPFDYIPRFMVIKNPTVNKHYSLAEKTLINLPSTSNQNMILHGMEVGTAIQLDVDFDKVKFVQDTSQVLGEGKTFTNKIDLDMYKGRSIKF